MREKADESGRVKEKVGVVCGRSDNVSSTVPQNAHLMADLADCRNVIHQHQHTISTQKQNVEVSGDTLVPSPSYSH